MFGSGTSEKRGAEYDEKIKGGAEKASIANDVDGRKATWNETERNFGAR